MPGHLSTETRGDVVHLAGKIDDTASLVDLVGRARKNRLVLDLHGITFINSLGVREWIRMQQAAASIGVAIELRRVAEPIVNQLNIVPAVRGVSLVTSFYAPYECEHCDSEHEILLDVRVHGAALARLQAPAIPCPECTKALTFSTPPELYFTFLAA